MKERRNALAESVHRQLRQLILDMARRKPGGHLIEAELERIELPAPLVLGGEDQAGRFAADLIAAIDDYLDETIRHATAFRPGRAYCHRCEGEACEEAEAPSSRHVFVGYARTGTPVWQEFSQLCLEARHPQVEGLFRDPPELLTLVHRDAELNGGLLEAFESHTFRVVGQVSAGFFRLAPLETGGRPVVALSFQAAVSVTADGRWRYGLNLLGKAPTGEPLHTLWEGSEDLPWRRAVRWTQSALQTLPRRPGGASPLSEIEPRVHGILNGLARRLQQDRRARTRRTRHAQERHDSGQRPTRKAIEDARSAREEACLSDRRSGAIVVLGDRGRTHFFTEDGRLVSSVRYSKEAIAKKRKLEQWVPAPPGALKRLHDQLPE